MEAIEAVVGPILVDGAVTGTLKPGQAPKAPGMKYRHYAPKASLTLVEGDAEAVTARINHLAAKKLEEGLRVGIICTEETKALYPAGMVKSIGLRADEATVAHNLYAVLREFDDLEADVIFSESFPADELGQAIMNRLNKAAGYQIIQA